MGARERASYAPAVARHTVLVEALPSWLDSRRLLGPTAADDPEGEGWTLTALEPGWLRAEARLDSEQAADLAARLRGVGLGGRAIACEIDPPLRRAAVRRARSEDARRRRDTSVGFERAGVRFDEEGRWSLTPEALALDIAAKAEGRLVVDAGCGLGGNSIAFARAGSPVVAIEVDRRRLELARHNARSYAVADRIRFVAGDAPSLAPEQLEAGAIVFVDPPWGRDWDRGRVGLAELPLLAAMRRVAQRAGAELWAKLPPSFAVEELLADRSGSAEAVFGAAAGDHRRVKFVLVRVEPTCRASA
jgi:SAM-dependent methyltransferase